MSLFGSLWEDEGAESDRKPKRTNHNELERRRRHAQRVKLEALRASVPSLQAVERCSTTTIIEKAKEHMDALNDRIKVLEEEIERSGANHMNIYPVIAHGSDPLIERLQRENSDLRMNFALCPHLAGNSGSAPGFKTQDTFGLSPACEPHEGATTRASFYAAVDGMREQQHDVDHQLALSSAQHSQHSRTPSYSGSFEHVLRFEPGVGVNVHCGQSLLCSPDGSRALGHGNGLERENSALFHTMGLDREVLSANGMPNAHEIQSRPVEYRAECPPQPDGLLSDAVFVKSEAEEWDDDESFQADILASPTPDDPFAPTSIYAPPGFSDAELVEIDRYPPAILHDVRCNACHAVINQGAVFSCMKCHQYFHTECAASVDQVTSLNNTNIQVHPMLCAVCSAVI
ncbi:hypothetical protein HDU89_006598 [Geranomyces variabilis]|nr:hypothetical protein HDU89_006598 [Geranomyces variabilis]